MPSSWLAGLRACGQADSGSPHFAVCSPLRHPKHSTGTYQGVPRAPSHRSVHQSLSFRCSLAAGSSKVPEGFRWAGTPAKRYFTFPVPPNGHCTWHGTWVQFTGNPSVPRTKFVAIDGAPQRPSSAAPRTSTGPSSPAARGARPLQAKVTSTLAMSSSVVHQPPARFKACPIPCHRADLVHW